MTIYDTKTGKEYASGDPVQSIGEELNFTTRARKFMIDLEGKIYLAFDGGNHVCLSCKHPGRFILTPTNLESK